ncbi:MAG: pseudaminic acid synthase [Deltaproteobacteria bacterium]|nr:pseudaminic acid synthase [Deltaproteobacteria bacterium]
MDTIFHIGARAVGPSLPVYIVAELSANHRQSFDQAVALIHAACDAHVDAIKLQTYTADTLTIRSDREYFRIGGGTLWDGRTLYELYQEAYTPWEWQPKLQQIAHECGLECFSSAFDASAVDFLERMDVPVHKVASFELVDLPLIQTMARTGKPLILSTGMATLAEIDEAVQAARSAGAQEIMLLKCTSAYPAAPAAMQLHAIPQLQQRYNVPIGLSDHTLDTTVPIAAVALGACFIEKHLTLSRATPGPDSAFSLEPAEFKALVEAVRTAEAALGTGAMGDDAGEAKSRIFRRSLFVVAEMQAGEAFTPATVRSIRPAHGLPPKHLPEILGRRAKCALPAGTPLTWDCVE